MTTLERTHVSSMEERFELYPVDQTPEPSMKPKGFWYEVDADWRRWASSEMPGWIEGRYLHRLTFGNEKILRLSTVAEIDRFDREYRSEKHYAGYSEQYGPMHMGIRWADIADSWDGIEIAPYQWSRRLDGPLWYYGWDCASGCIWRPQGATLTPIGPAPLFIEEEAESDPGLTR